MPPSPTRNGASPDMPTKPSSPPNVPHPKRYIPAAPSATSRQPSFTTTPPSPACDTLPTGDTFRPSVVDLQPVETRHLGDQPHIRLRCRGGDRQSPDRGAMRSS